MVNLGHYNNNIIMIIKRPFQQRKISSSAQLR